MNDVILWLDVETSGLSVYEHELLEVAAIPTTLDGSILGVEYSSLVRPANPIPQVIEAATPEARVMHESNGLWEDLWDNEVKTTHEVSEDLLHILDSLGSDIRAIPGGTSLNHDLAFVRIKLPDVALRLSHQIIDTTTLKLVNEMLNGTKPYMRQGAHRALPDTWDAIEEYRTHLTTMRRTNSHG